MTYDQAKLFYGNFIGPMCFDKMPPLPPAPTPSPPFALRRGDDCLVPATTSPGVEAVPCAEATGANWVSSATDGLLAWRAKTELRYLKLDQHPDADNTTLPQFCRRGRDYLNPDLGTGRLRQGYVLNTTDGTLRSSVCRVFACLLAGPPGERATSGQCHGDGASGWEAVRP